MDYKSAGVNVELADNLINKISGISNQIGKFAAEYELDKKLNRQLVASCDGVGTKIMLAKYAKEKYNRSLASIGADCVAMVVNDLLCENATPLFFMDYFATNSLEESDYLEVIQGISNSCSSNNMSLIGGETAELPGMFKDNHFDVCGFGIGTKDFLDWYPVKEGDLVIGLHSTGVHSNGFSLVRKLLEPDDYTEDFLDKLLKPTKIYTQDVKILKDNYFGIKKLVHITGGGFNNIDRVLPNKFCVKWDSEQTIYSNKEIFTWIQNKSNLDKKQMQSTFNCGIGMIAILEQNRKDFLPLNNYSILGEIVIP